MSDLEVLYLVLVALYAWECAAWLPRDSLALTSWFNRSWRVVHPSPLLGNQRGGLTFAAPLPPLGSIFCASQFPLALSPDALLAFVAPAINPGWPATQTGRCVRFEDLQSVRAKGSKVLVNDSLLFRASSAWQAGHWAKQIDDISKLPRTQRAAAIEKLVKTSFNTEALKTRIQLFKKISRPLPWLTNSLFVFLFFVIPVVLWKIGLHLTWPFLLGSLLMLTTFTAVYFWRAHKQLYPEAEDERFNHFMLIWLAPATSVRALDPLSRPLLATFHPLSIARELSPPADFQKLARIAWLNLRFPGAQPILTSNPVAAETHAHFLSVLLPITENFLKRHGLRPSDLESAPTQADSSSIAYCPRCHSQFTTTDGGCPDCGGVGLVPFKRAARS